MQEPNADQNKINSIFGMEKKLFKFELEPGILATNLLKCFENKSLSKSGTCKDNLRIKEIVDKIDNLSNNLVNLIKDFKEKFDFLGDRIYEYALINAQKVGTKENKIQNLNNEIAKIYELINSTNERIKAIEDFKNNAIVNIDNTLK